MENVEKNDSGIRGGAGKLVFLGAALAVLLCIGAAFAPPYEGDAYDYGEIALRIVQRHDMLERHLRYFNIPGQNPTHPAAQRANYYSIFTAPFAAVFGARMWTIFLPGLLGALAIPFTVYAFGRRMFGGREAWWAALMCLFNPRLIYHALRDPTPETWLAALCVVSAYLFLNRRYAFSGAVLGVAFFVKQSAVALLPAYFLYIVFFERRELRRAALWLGLAAFIAAASPFLIRNAVLFGNPLYTEETASRQHFNPQTIRDGNLLKAIFERGDQAADAHKDDSRQSFLVKTLSLADVNFRDNIIGSQNIDYFPGFFPLIFYACAPLLIAGLWLGRASPAVRLCGLCAVFYLAFHVLIVVHFETRYIFPTLPFGALIAARGAYELQSKFPKFNARAALLFALLTGSAATLPFMVLQTVNRDEHVRANEYISACRYLKSNSPANSTIMAWPPFSATFFSDREAVPYVYGGLSTQVRVLKKYGVDYVLFNDLMYTGEPPFFDFLKPVAKGRFMSLYKVDEKASGYSKPEKLYEGLEGYNPLETIYKRTREVPVRLDWPVELVLSKLCGGVAGAAAAALAMFAIFHFLATRQNRGVRKFAVVAILLFCFGARAAHLKRIAIQDMTQSPVNAAQVVASAGPEVTQLVIVGDPIEFGDYARVLSEAFPERLTFSPVITAPPKRGALFMPLRERGGELLTERKVAEWGGEREKLRERENTASSAAAALGLLPVRVGGGVLLLNGEGRIQSSSFARVTNRE